MSYILEALKKADRKRKLGEVPDVHTDHDDLVSEEPAKRLLWPYLLALLLFFNAAVIFWWLEPWVNKPLQKETQGESSVQNDAVGQAPAEIANIQQEGEEAQELIEQSQGSDVASAVSELSTPESHAVVPGEEASVEQLPPSSDQKKQEESALGIGKVEAVVLTPAASGDFVEPEKKLGDQAQVLETAQEPLTEVKKQQGSIPIKPSPNDKNGDAAKAEVSESGAAGGELSRATTAPQKEKGTAVEDLVEGESEEIDGSLSNIPETDEFDETETSDNATEQVIKTEIFDISRVPFVYQLPPSFQKKIPEITISFHSYTFRPATRMARINGRIMREGQALTKEIKLDKIVPTGAVFMIEKRRFRVDV